MPTTRRVPCWPWPRMGEGGGGSGRQHHDLPRAAGAAGGDVTLNTDVATLGVTLTGPANLQVVETDAVDLAGVTTANGAITVTAGGGAISITITGHQRVQSIEMIPSCSTPRVKPSSID